MQTAEATKGVLSACKPRQEVLDGELDDAIFAADFGQLIDGSGAAPKVYGHAETFFRNTEPTPDLKSVCAAVFKALADKKEAGQLIRLTQAVYTQLGQTLTYHVDSRLAEENLKARLLTALKRGPLTNAQIREITQLDRNQTWSLMNQLRLEGLVKPPGRGRHSRWSLQPPPTS